jgi:tetratricopeptide (TPR) repeat protein
MCRARLAIAARKWNQAQLHENDATVAAERLQEKTDDKKLVDWVRSRLDDIVELKQYRYSSTIYWEAMSRAGAEIKKALREEDFDRIRKDLETAIGAPDVNLTRQQEIEVAKLRQSIERERFLFLFRQAVEQGQALLTERRYDEAEAQFKKAHAMFGGDYAAAKFVSRQQQQQLLDEVDRQLQTLQKRREDDRDIAAYNAAKTSGDVDALEVAIRNLLRKTDISTDDRKRFTAELKTIEINKELAKARQYTTQGNITAAETSWQRVLALSPGHAEAAAALAGIGKAVKRSDLMGRGEKAFTDRKFDEALKLFRQAAALGKGTNVASRITDCLFEIEYAKGRQLARNRKYDQAAEAYNRAKETKPAEAVRIDGIIDLMRKQQQYENFITAANAALANKKYDRALALFDEARKVDDTAEVAKGIRFTNYSKYMHLARQAKEAGDNKTARWQARRAMKVMDTPEVQAFLKSVGGDVEE